MLRDMPFDPEVMVDEDEGHKIVKLLVVHQDTTLTLSIKRKTPMTKLFSTFCERMKIELEQHRFYVDRTHRMLLPEDSALSLSLEFHEVIYCVARRLRPPPSEAMDMPAQAPPQQPVVITKAKQPSPAAMATVLVAAAGPNTPKVVRLTSRCEVTAGRDQKNKEEQIEPPPVTKEFKSPERTANHKASGEEVKHSSTGSSGGGGWHG